MAKTVAECPELMEEYVVEKNPPASEAKAHKQTKYYWKCKWCNTITLRAVQNQACNLPECIQSRKLASIKIDESLLSRKCSNCKSVKPIENFQFRCDRQQYRYESLCKKCATEAKQIRRKNTNVRSHLVRLLERAKGNAKRRSDRGRTTAGTCSLTIEDLEELWDAQQGLCYYSDVPLMYNTTNVDWRCSLERINPKLGYHVGNIALVVLEFNGTVQWSTDLIEYAYTSSIESDVDPSIYEEMSKCSWDRKEVKFEGIVTEMRDNEIWKECKFCREFKHERHFPKYYPGRCKKCEKIQRSLEKYDIREFLRGQIAGAKHSTTRRRSKGRQMEDCQLTPQDLVDMYCKQGGRCAYSNIPLQIPRMGKSEEFVMSIERLNTKVGYIKSNVVLICRIFNTPDQSSRRTGTGSCGWSREKWGLVMKCLTDRKSAESYNLSDTFFVSLPY